jgi:hypothetical protein
LAHAFSTLPVVRYSFYITCWSEAMDAAKQREIIRLWNRLRLLEREGRPTAAVRRQIERALEEQVAA